MGLFRRKYAHLISYQYRKNDNSWGFGRSFIYDNKKRLTPIRLIDFEHETETSRHFKEVVVINTVLLERDYV